MHCTTPLFLTAMPVNATFSQPNRLCSNVALQNVTSRVGHMQYYTRRRRAECPRSGALFLDCKVDGYRSTNDKKVHVMCVCACQMCECV